MDLNKILNPVIGVTGLLALALSATLALAESNETIKIKVKTDDGISETVVIDNLEVGMTEVFVTESGKEVLVTREDSSLTMEVEGKTIEVKMPNVQSLHMDSEDGHQMVHRMKFMSKDGELHEFDGDGENVFICSGDDSSECGTHSKAIWIDSGDFDGEDVVIDMDGNTEGKRVIIKHIDHDFDSDVDIDDLLTEMQIDIETLTEGAGDHEVIVIKRSVELHTESDDN